MKALIDKRDGVRNTDNVLDNADIDSVLKLFSKLDGKRHTLISINRDDGWYLMIGGGPAQYIITLGNDVNNLTLHNQDGDEANMIELCAGGQFGEFPENICVRSKYAEKAIKLFFRGQEEQLNWL